MHLQTYLISTNQQFWFPNYVKSYLSNSNDILSPVKGFLVLGLLKFIPVSVNPTISMPWVTPGFVTAFFQGGILSISDLGSLSLGIDFLMYLPFFLIDDKNALRQEQENA